MKKNSAAQGKKKTAASVHLSHHGDLPRLRRIKGQVEGLERMIQEGRYCVDILTQIKAARSAMSALEGSVMQRHLEGCDVVVDGGDGHHIIAIRVARVRIGAVVARRSKQSRRTSSACPEG